MKKAKIITRDEARRRAARHVAARIFRGATVLDGAEANLKCVPGPWEVEDVWVIYPNIDGNDLGLLRASQIVVVCKRTGRVLYDGSARDEG